MKPYSDRLDKSRQVEKMFDRIAPRYDFLNHTLSAGIDRFWRRIAVCAVKRNSPHRILDVATGTADLAVMMARRMKAAQIVGIDPSEGMLAIGQGKLERRGMSGQITLCKGLASAPGFPPESFDAVSVAFGVRNFENIPDGLKGMCEVLRPGGKMVILEFSMPKNKIFAPLYRFYFHRILPRIGGMISGDVEAYRYLPGSVDDFPPPRRFVEMLREAGLEKCRARPLTFGIAYLYTGNKMHK